MEVKTKKSFNDLLESLVEEIIEEEELGITIPVSFLNPETGEEEVEYFTVDQQNKAQEKANKQATKGKK